MFLNMYFIRWFDHFLKMTDTSTGWPLALEFLEFFELFWNFFFASIILEKGHFFSLVLEFRKFRKIFFFAPYFYNTVHKKGIWIHNLWNLSHCCSIHSNQYTSFDSCVFTNTFLARLICDFRVLHHY